MSQSIESRIKARNKREATRAWAASISAEREKQDEAENRLRRAYVAASKVMLDWLGDDYGAVSGKRNDAHAPIFAALISAYRE